ncbi:MAG TPA: VOC family protein, partial [Usitatibacteraceae bacterium]|nr:VOC family protein [Usitatibacteraceae bacterium]
MDIDRIDHFVLTVKDVEATCDFYSRVLGMEPVTFAGGRRGLAFGRQKINLHQQGREFE